MNRIQKGFVFIGFIALTVSAAVAQNSLSNGTITKVALTADEKKAVADFETALKDYIVVRDRVWKQVPKPPDKATPQQIATYKTALRQGVQMTWANAVPGDIFKPSVATFIKSRIKEEFTGWERSELRKTVLEADTKGVPLKVNAVYPESKELVEMSPALLLALPQLPKELRYRFIGRSLVIMDRDDGLIVDYLRDALP
jgi:hypothetical protein